MLLREFFDKCYEVEEGFGTYAYRLKDELLDSVRKAPLPDVSDFEIAQALAELLGKELLAHVSGDPNRLMLEDRDFRVVLRTLRIVSGRVGVPVNPPFHDYLSFDHMIESLGSAADWETRKSLAVGDFGRVKSELVEKEWHSDSHRLLLPVSPHAELGWEQIDGEIIELRAAFARSRTQADYADIGSQCVRIHELIGDRIVLTWGKQFAEERIPPRANTKDRFDLAIAAVLTGADLERLRRYARACVVLSQEVKHGGNANRTNAGITADATIALANMIRRLADGVGN